MKYFCQPHILAKKSFSPHIIPKTKGLEESLAYGRRDATRKKKQQKNTDYYSCVLNI